MNNRGGENGRFFRQALAGLPGTIFLRKEVIQPQVLLRLPCYDLVLVAEFTVGVALRAEARLGKRLRVPPAYVA